MAVLSAAAAVVGIAALVFARRPILELWHLHRLESGDKQTRLEAMLTLAMMQSSRAVPPLLEIVASEKDEEVWHWAMTGLSWMDAEAVIAHLRVLVSASKDGEAEVVRRHSRLYLERVEALEWFGPAGWPRDPTSLDDFRLILTKWKDFMDTVK